MRLEPSERMPAKWVAEKLVIDEDGERMCESPHGGSSPHGYPSIAANPASKVEANSSVE